MTPPIRDMLPHDPSPASGLFFNLRQGERAWLSGADTDGTKLTESMVVVEYLDAKYPDQGSKLIPTDAAQAAKVQTACLHSFF